MTEVVVDDPRGGLLVVLQRGPGRSGRVGLGEGRVSEVGGELGHGCGGGRWSSVVSVRRGARIGNGDWRRTTRSDGRQK